MIVDPASDFLILATPMGVPLLAEYDREGLKALRFWKQGDHPPARTRDDAPRGDAVGRAVLLQLREYFAGERRDFDLPLVAGGTAFQRRVWGALRRIPFGETRSYKQLAALVGSPAAVRAVGQANARNPIPIIVPCHRVLAADGGLGGYLGYWEGDGHAPDLKRWLLEHERGNRGQ
ncbi:MAG TPA: methylated-DNA--[protein]-cysteine S-methyltransferase [Longimicrobiaceae bacterium]